MSSILHFCFSLGARENLKRAISKNLIKSGNVISTLDDLSKGPINDISNISTRVNWNKNFQFIYNYSQFEKELITSYEDFHETIKNINNEEINIWYGDNSIEICGLLYTLSLIHKKTNKINFLRYLPSFSEDYKYVSIYKGTHEIFPEKLSDIFNSKFNLSNEEISELIKVWDSLKKDNTNARVVEFSNTVHIPHMTASKENRWPTIIDEYFIPPLDGIKKIKSVNEDYYDNLLLESVRSNYSDVLNIIGSVIGNELDAISDSFLFYRLVHLIQCGYIYSTGNLNSMRDLNVILKN